MNTFLEDLFEDEELKELDKWSQSFWGVNSDHNSLKIQFSQQGYEDKGYGHIQRIISNVGELLENYFTILYDLNDKEDKGDFLGEMKKAFKENLILFYVAAHLHDIGMKFPGIFEALSKYVNENSQNPLHIGKITHEYHHYISFIVLMEMICQEIGSKGPYLSNISKSHPEGCKRLIEDKENLNFILNNIFERYFSDLKKSIERPWEFKVILAILCLLHKEVNIDYVHRILRNFKDENTKNSIVVETFNRWWSYFERANLWTEKMCQRFLRYDSIEPPECDDMELLEASSGQKIDLSLVEALLQYGDKTEITIARLVRKPLDKEGNPIEKMPLEDFIKDTEYDGRKGYICTNIAQGVISDFARTRACLFIPVLLIKVENMAGKNKKKDKKNKEKNETVPSEEVKPGLNIVLLYLRFDGDNDVFKRIRYYNEKDFFELGFLRVIRFHLPAVIHLLKEADALDKKYKENPVFTLTFKMEEHSIKHPNITNLIREYPESSDGFKLLKGTIMGNRNKDRKPRKNFPYTRQNLEAIERISQPYLDSEDRFKVKEPKKVFYETCDLDVPASFELMAVLNLFMEEEG
jgi:hypothetical protein